jgi:transcriptional regulator with XRE-family HTH domain
MARKLQSVRDAKLEGLRATAEYRYLKVLEAWTDLVFVKATYENDWSWRELARRAGVSYPTVYRLGMYETVYPRFHTLWKIARAVGVDISIRSNNADQKTTTDQHRSQSTGRSGKTKV